jgi:hypothetical protein
MSGRNAFPATIDKNASLLEIFRLFEDFSARYPQTSTAQFTV